MPQMITLGQFIIEKQTDFPFAKGGFSRLIRDLAIAAKIVNREVNKTRCICKRTIYSCLKSRWRMLFNSIRRKRPCDSN